MFYNVAKASREKEKREAERLAQIGADDGRSSERGRSRQRNKSPGSRQSSAEMDPGLWGRSIHARSRSRSPAPPGTPRSVTQGSDTGEAQDEGDDDISYNDIYDDERGSSYGEEEEPNEFIYVPTCMLGAPLKDFDSGQENVSTHIFFFFLQFTISFFLMCKQMW